MLLKLCFSSRAKSKNLVPLLQCTSKNRCALFMRSKKKKKYIILITRWIKIMSLILSLSLSLSLSLIFEHHSLRSLTFSLRPLTPSLQLASHSLTPISHSLNSDHLSSDLSLSQLRLPKPSLCHSDLSLSQLRSPKPPIHPFCRSSSPT